jgi:hypothetical protein
LGTATPSVGTKIIMTVAGFSPVRPPTTGQQHHQAQATDLGARIVAATVERRLAG